MPLTDAEVASLRDFRDFRDADPDRFQAILDGYFEYRQTANIFNVSAMDALENEDFVRSPQGRDFRDCLRSAIAGQDNPYREPAKDLPIGRKNQR